MINEFPHRIAAMFFVFGKEGDGRIQGVEDQLAKIIFKYSTRNFFQTITQKGYFFIVLNFTAISFYVKPQSYFLLSIFYRHSICVS